MVEERLQYWWSEADVDEMILKIVCPAVHISIQTFWLSESRHSFQPDEYVGWGRGAFSSPTNYFIQEEMLISSSPFQHRPSKSTLLNADGYVDSWTKPHHCSSLLCLSTLKPYICPQTLIIVWIWILPIPTALLFMFPVVRMKLSRF